MNRKIWIDWNVDGDFDDAGEMVASQPTGTSTTWSGSFTVPNVANAFDATTRMRIGTSYGNDVNHPCGANGAPNANRIGEFEDYSIRVKNDGDIPVISLIGADTIYVEQNTSYTDPGAVAIDPSQGDFSSELMVSSDVDVSLTGIYSVIFDVEDASGNKAETVERTVYVVVDQTPPVITVQGKQVDTIEVGSTWADAGATAVDNQDGNLDNAIVTTGTVDPFTIGTYYIEYYVQDAQANASLEVRTVVVVDTELPVIDNASADKVSDPDAWIVEVQLNSVFVDVTTATDNYNTLADNLSLIATPGIGQEALVDTRFKGSTLVHYVATDESGNMTEQAIRYVIQDYEPPVIDLHTLDVIKHPVNETYTPVPATATDNLYSSTEISINVSSNVNPFVLGTYEDVYTAQDASGNISTKTRTVIVVDEVAPEIKGKSGDIYKVGLYSNFAAIERLVFTDNYDDPDLLKANAEVIHTDINTFEVGIYSATFVTRDASGNVSDPFILYVIVERDRYRVGVEDLDPINALKVSPNPTSGLLNISVDLPENENIEISVFNTMGQKVTDVVSGSVTRGNYSVDLSRNSDGIYTVRMQIGDKIINRKVVLSN